MSFPRPTQMFQFRRFPSYTYLIQYRIPYGGFPHSEISGSMLICSSPKLIAAYHVLHRLLMPRHSPCALYSLTYSEEVLFFFCIKLNRKVQYNWFSSQIRIMQTHLFYQQNCNYPFSSKQASYRSLPSKLVSSFIPLLLLSNLNPLRWASNLNLIKKCFLTVAFS